MLVVPVLTELRTAVAILHRNVTAYYICGPGTLSNESRFHTTVQDLNGLLTSVSEGYYSIILGTYTLRLLVGRRGRGRHQLTISGVWIGQMIAR